jgi:hypothetical protein
MKKLQNGFTVVEGLLIVVTVGILGGTGWYVWQAKSQADKNLSSANNVSQNVPTPTKSIKTFDDCKNAAGSKILTTYPEQCVTKDGKKFTQFSQQYLTIKEWGVRGKYSSNLTLRYMLLEDSSSSPPEVVKFSSTQLDASDSACKGSYGGFFERYKSSEHYLEGDDGLDSGKTAVQYASTIDKKFYAHVGNYFYFFRSPGAACNESKSSQDLQGQTGDAVLEVLASLGITPAQ